MREVLWKRLGVGGGMGLALGLLAILASNLFPTPFNALEARLWDLRCRLHAPPPDTLPVEDIVIVDIDSRSLYKLGRYRQWPRSYHARLIDLLARDGALAVAFDVLFIDLDRFPQEDSALVRATRKAGNVLHALMFSEVDSLNFLYEMEEDPYLLLNPSSSYLLPEAPFPVRRRIEGPFPALARTAEGLGSVDLFPDPDGVVRSVPLFERFLDHSYATLGLKIFLDLMGIREKDIELRPGAVIFHLPDRALEVPVDREGHMIISYLGGFRSFRYISYYDVLEGRVPEGFFRDKVIFVGSSAPGLMDLRSTPLSPKFPGVEVHANVLYNLLSRSFFRRLGKGESWALVLLVALISGALALAIRPPWGTVGTFLMFGAVAYAGFFPAFARNLWMPVVQPLWVGILAYIGAFAHRLLTEEREKHRIKEAFQTYVSPAVVEELLTHPELAGLGGRRAVLTVLFSDLADFTPISEGMDPEELVAFLNEYLTEMTELVLVHGGTVDKFEGDAIMAFFGAPLPLPDHPLRAVRAALEMQGKMRTLREKWARERKPQVRMRIGLSTGEVVVGNMGSHKKMDYTVMGDTVNLAARLEGVNKVYRTEILVSYATYKAAGDILAREIDTVRVKGKAQAVRIYEPLGMDSPPKAVRKARAYEEGLRLYRERRWEEAVWPFEEVLRMDPGDGPASVLRKRCITFLDSPPPEDWDGVWELTQK